MHRGGTQRHMQMHFRSDCRLEESKTPFCNQKKTLRGRLNCDIPQCNQTIPSYNNVVKQRIEIPKEQWTVVNPLFFTTFLVDELVTGTRIS